MRVVARKAVWKRWSGVGVSGEAEMTLVAGAGKTGSVVAGCCKVTAVTPCSAILAVGSSLFAAVAVAVAVVFSP